MLRKRVLILTFGLFPISVWILSFHFILDPRTIHPPPRKAELCDCSSFIAKSETEFSENTCKGPEPFFVSGSHMSESVFKYWSNLQRERSSFTSYKETEVEVLRMFLPGPKLTKPSPGLYRMCAVVGNSANLKGSHYGPLIDFHNIVLRMNKAPTEGYERDVGSKTTHHVMYPVSASKLDNTTHLVFFPFKKSDLDWLINTFTPRGEKNDTSGFLAKKDLVMILNPEFIRYVHCNWLGMKGMYPSTGFLTVILSLQVCNEVNVFGFGADSSGNWNHYFEELTDPKLKTGNHAGDDELKIIQRLQDQQKIRFFTGW